MIKKIITISATLVLSALVGATNAFAYVGGSRDGGVSGGGCAPAGATSWWDTCHGATWKWYSTNSNSVSIPKAGNVSGGTITGCKKAGGYWRYGLDHFNPSTGGSYGDQAGLVNWSDVAWDSAHSDIQNINDLKEIFEDYADEFANLGFVWDEGNFSAFCAGKESGKKTTFQGHTTISITGSDKTVKSGWDGFKSGTYTTTADSVKLTFTHKIKRTDNKDVATNVKWKLATADDGLSASAIGTNNDRIMNFASNERNGFVKDATTTEYDIRMDPGTTKTICQGINHELEVKVKNNGSRSGSQSGTRGSSKACITIKRKGVDIQNPSFAKTETSYIGESSTLTKTGAHTIYFYISNTVDKPSDSQVKGGATKDYGEGEGSTPGADDSASANSAICSNFNSLCRTYTEASSNDIIIPDDANLVGAKVCAASSSKNSVFKETRTRTKDISYKDADGNTVEETITEEYDVYTYYWKFSDLSCSPIAKKPNFQVIGGAVYSAGKIDTSKSSKVAPGPSQNKTYGSWSEYLAIAGDTIKNFGSGATLRVGSDNASLSKNSPLTIANDSSRFGYSGIDSSSSTNFINALKTRFIDSDKYNHDLVNVIYRDGNYDLDPSDLVADKHNIIYAKNINIPASITEINAWLIAENTINTCLGFTTISALSADVCNQPLTINGITYAKNLKLFRTAGALAGNNSADSAEIFNLTAGDYRRAYNYASTTYMQPSVVYTQELAPRI